MESVKIVNDNTCHDCGKEIILNNDEVSNGVYLEYEKW